MSKPIWLDDAVRMKVDENLTWNEVTAKLRHHFPKDANEVGVYNSIRDKVRKTDKYKQMQRGKSGSVDNQSVQQSCKTTYRDTGEVVFDEIIELLVGEQLTPEHVMAAHNLKPSEWKVVLFTSNVWQSQVKGGNKIALWQSKLTVKPNANGVDIESAVKHFEMLDRKGVNPVPMVLQTGNRMAEVNISDAHLGKLCWHGDTPEDYDSKIAKQVFNSVIGEISMRLSILPIEEILFVWANDFFNSDNEAKTTTAGTPQDTDLRAKKMFNIGCEMLVTAIESLKHATNNPDVIIPVKTFYTPSNHDEETSYHALGFLKAWFRNDPDVTVDQDAYPRKYIAYGNSLTGFTHGDKENSNGSKDKASRLASLMPIEARDLWGKAKYCEMHAAHLHSEQMIQEINGVIVRRISSPTATDTWHTTSGYIGSVRKAQVFIYDKERGILDIMNVPIG